MADRITLNGKAPRATAPKPTAAPRTAPSPGAQPPNFAAQLADAIQQGTMVDPSLLAAAQSNSGSIATDGAAAANVAALTKMVQALQAVKRNTDGAADTMAQARQGLTLLRRAGITPSREVLAAERALGPQTGQGASPAPPAFKPRVRVPDSFAGRLDNAVKAERGQQLLESLAASRAAGGPLDPGKAAEARAFLAAQRPATAAGAARDIGQILREQERTAQQQSAEKVKADREAQATRKQAERDAQMAPGGLFSRGQYDALRQSPGINPANRFGQSGPTSAVASGPSIFTAAQQRAMAASGVLNGEPNPTLAARPQPGAGISYPLSGGGMSDPILRTLTNIDKSTAGTFKIESSLTGAAPAMVPPSVAHAAQMNARVNAAIAAGATFMPPGTKAPTYSYTPMPGIPAAPGAWTRVGGGPGGAGVPPLLPPTGGGGGLGGGGGGGGGGSGGGGGGGNTFFGGSGRKGILNYGIGKAASRIPYIGGAASTIIEAGAIGGPAAAGVAALIEAADFAVFNKQYVGRAIEAGAANASRARDLRINAYAIARAQGSTDGERQMNTVFTPNSEGLLNAMAPPELLKRYGITAEEAFGDINKFGIVQRARTDPSSRIVSGDDPKLLLPSNKGGYPGEAHKNRDGTYTLTGIASGNSVGIGVGPSAADMNSDLIAALNEPKNDPSFSNMDQDKLKADAGLMARYGFIKPDAAGVTQFFEKLRPVMTDAVASGTDRSSMAQSIVGVMAGAAQRGSMGVDQQEVQSYLGRFTGFAGGRTGELGASTMGALNAGSAQVGQSPIQSMAYMQAAQKYNTEGKLAKAFGQGGIPEDMKGVAKDYFEALEHGDMPAAAHFLSVMAADHPTLQQDISNDATSGLPFHYQRSIADQGFSPGKSGAAASNWDAKPQAARKPQTTTAEQSAASQRVMNQLMKEGGYTKEQAAGIVGNLMWESRMDPRARNPSNHVGLAQWDATRQREIAEHFKKPFDKMTESEQTSAIIWELGQGNGDKRLRQQTTVEGSSDAFDEDFERSAKKGSAEMQRENANRRPLAQQAYGMPTDGSGTGVPQTSYDQTATGGQAGLVASEDAFKNMNFLITSLGALAKAVSQTAEKINHANKGNPFGGRSGADQGAFGGNPQTELGNLGP